MKKELRTSAKMKNYVDTAPTSSSGGKPIVSRRRRPMVRLSSSPVNTVEAQGTAYLCFPVDHSWFQGNISTDDESNYSLYGERVAVSAEEKARAAAAFAKKISNMSLTESDEENNNAGDEGAGSESEEDLPAEDYYRVTMIDHFSGLKHVLPKIFVREVNGVQVFTSQQEEVTFQVENTYKGQKAEMMIQKYLGSPGHLGPKCLLYSGEINILFDDMMETGRSWSL